MPEVAAEPDDRLPPLPTYPRGLEQAYWIEDTGRDGWGAADANSKAEDCRICDAEGEVVLDGITDMPLAELVVALLNGVEEDHLAKRVLWPRTDADDHLARILAYCEDELSGEPPECCSAILHAIRIIGLGIKPKAAEEGK